jgi:hypothetical protein
MNTDRCGNICRQKCPAKGSGKEFRYRNTINVELEMDDYTSYNWSHWNSNKMLKEKPGSYTRKHSIDSLQKTAILGTSHIIWKVL